MDITSYLLGKKAGGGKGNLKYVVVEELPTTGEDNTIYLVPKSSSKTNNYYDEYMYIDSSWELIGNTEIDLSTKQDIMQFSTMPTASVNNLGKIIQYTGTTGNDYTNGYFYICVSDEQSTPTYSWEQIDIQPSASYTAGTNIEITNAGVINNTIPYAKDRNDSSPNMRIGSTNVIPNAAYQTLVVGEGSVSSLASNSLAVGINTSTTGTNSIVLGYQAVNGYSRSIAIGASAQTTKNNQAMFGSSSAPINEMTIYTSSGAKVMATEDYVDNLVGNINTVLATLTTPGGNA